MNETISDLHRRYKLETGRKAFYTLGGLVDIKEYYNDYTEWLEKLLKKQPPYITKVETTIVEEYNPNYGDKRICKCGHSYHLHFDPCEDMDNVGCKYCDCNNFKEATKIKAVINGNEILIGHKGTDGFIKIPGFDYAALSKEKKEFLKKNHNFIAE